MDESSWDPQQQAHGTSLLPTWRALHGGGICHPVSGGGLRPEDAQVHTVPVVALLGQVVRQAGVGQFPQRRRPLEPRCWNDHFQGTPASDARCLGRLGHSTRWRALHVGELHALELLVGVRNTVRGVPQWQSGGERGMTQWSKGWGSQWSKGSSGP